MANREQWLALATRCEKATGPDRGIDRGVAVLLGWEEQNSPGYGVFWVSPEKRVRIVPDWTASLDAITALIERELPGWMCRVQWCGVSAEAWVAPDLNNPACPQFYRCYEAKWHDYAERNEVEIRPGSRQAAILALCAAFCRAMAEKP